MGIPEPGPVRARLRLQFELRLGDFELRVDEDLEVGALALFGPSGAGKTTLLEVVAGWRTPARGRIDVAGRTVFAAEEGIDLPRAARRVGYVPQDGLLFPHLDVRRNVLYGAGDGSGPGAIAIERVLEILEIDRLLDRRVESLSGGERQRVALGRALLASPALLLLDEPLAAVDAARRQRILPYIQRVRDELAVPLVYVTHQSAEARAVADQALILERGRVVARGGVDLLPA